MKFNSTSLLITWSPPVWFSYDIYFVSSISYQVLVTDEEDGDIILDTTIPANTYIATPNIIQNVQNVTQCDTFNISVTALLAQYSSINTISNNGSK